MAPPVKILDRVRLYLVFFVVFILLLVMKIELEEPFKSKWKNAYLVTNSENRRNVCLYNDPDDRTTISYARYLMSVKLGRFLDDDVHVDHKDDDKTNDNIDNLQLLTPESNNQKEAERHRIHDVIYHACNCTNCGKEFILNDRQMKMKLQAGTKHLFCTKECFQNAIKNGHPALASMWEHSKSTKGTNRISLSLAVKEPETVAQIKSLRREGLSVYKIADKLNIARNTVMKYW